MIERVLPAGVEAAEHAGPPVPAPLHPSEEAAVVDAMPARRAEYAAVRECARTALRRLGLADAAVPAGPDRAPVWPPGIVGSMTHVDGYRAAAVGRADTWAGIGIDAEVRAPLPPEVASLVMSDDERSALARTDPALCLDRVLFSAKESVYKVWYPVTRSWLGFEDVDVRLGDGTFTARIGRTGLRTDVLHGRWAVGDGLVVTAIALARA
ncbi:4'-phosphopantetheinyl transferase family protein [Cellulomonas humilata]|uniref:4'-phosphopantetheinyl transferase EntD n=1 Tax=Cellulomonas humilata TaxID=144055 RepID=A0ABU0EFB3_9CELL|nr:4'-phosphopantetheinyl transferase superfamily protein [Cellulomonas humilata]MDQ0373507.1 4'-phosphopantetheinyl transferase EntD [Cellulomonas humilata]